MSTIRKQTDLRSVRNAAREVMNHLGKVDANRDGKISEAEVKRYAKSVKQPKVVADALLAVASEALKGKASKSVAVSVMYRQVTDTMKLIDKQDKNHNGKLDLGNELKGANSVKTFQALATMANSLDFVTGKMTAYQLETAISPWALKATYSSEGDYSPIYFRIDTDKTITAANAMSVLKPELHSYFCEDAHETVPYSRFTGEMMSASDARSFINGLVDDEDVDPKNTEAWAKVTSLLKNNLTDIKVIKAGPKDSDGSLAVDQGFYIYTIVGKTADGKTAGVMIASAET